jgi:hypothetical protein
MAYIYLCIPFSITRNTVNHIHIGKNVRAKERTHATLKLRFQSLHPMLGNGFTQHKEIIKINFNAMKIL